MTDFADNILQQAFEGEKVSLEELLMQKLELYNLSRTKVIKMLDIDKDVFNQIIAGTVKQPTVINVLKIAQFLEISEREVIASLVSNMDYSNVAGLERAKKAGFLSKNFDLKTLIKIGFLPNTDDVEVLANRIMAFFGLESIYEYQTELSAPLYRKVKKSFSDKMRDLWIASAYKLFKDINNPNEYNREGLKDVVHKMRPYSQDVDNGLESVCRALYHVGVTVIVQAQLTTTGNFGASFVIDNKPCIVLTDYGKSYPNLWITLTHEIEHVLFDFEHLQSNGFHLSGEPDIFLLEDKAVEFSWDYFCTKEMFDFIKIHINNPYVIQKFADQNHVHVSILYWAYMHYQQTLHNKNAYSYYKEYFPDYSRAIKNIGIIKWKEDEILPKIAKDLKEIFELNTTTNE